MSSLEGNKIAAAILVGGMITLSVGIATDHCVRATALDAVREGFDTRVLLGMTAGVALDTTERTLVEMRSAGVQLDGEPVVRSA